MASEAVPCVIIAGGRGRRMGGTDKCLLPLGDRRMLDWIRARLRPQVTAMALNANRDPSRFAGFGVPVIADTIGEDEGPLAGILAAMEWATGLGARRVLTAAGDTPFPPADLAARLAAVDGLVLARSDTGTHPVFGLWPVELSSVLRRHLEGGGSRRVTDFTDAQGGRYVDFAPMSLPSGPVDSFLNVNTPDDLATAMRLAEALQP